MVTLIGTGPENVEKKRILGRGRERSVFSLDVSIALSRGCGDAEEYEGAQGLGSSGS